MKLSIRDVELLRLVGEQYALSVDQLARLIGRSPRTGRWLRDRWRAAGWIESRQLTVEGPSFLWLTGAGARIAGSSYRLWRPNPTLARHLEAVTEVRLQLERERRLGQWVCERELAKRLCARDRRRHLPDALLLVAGEQIAIEVELSQKSRARLEALLLELARDHDRVWYFAAPPLVSLLRELADELPWGHVLVQPYPPRPTPPQR